MCQAFWLGRTCNCCKNLVGGNPILFQKVPFKNYIDGNHCVLTSVQEDHQAYELGASNHYLEYYNHLQLHHQETYNLDQKQLCHQEDALFLYKWIV